MTQEHLLNLIWFRSDLRVYDNPALSAAMSSGPSIAVYVISEETWDAHNESPAKRSLILRQLEILSGALSELNVPFYVLTAESMQKLESSISEFASQLKVSHLFYNEDYGLNERRLAKSVSENLRNHGIISQSFHDQCIVSPGTLRNQKGSYYHVFSAFKRAFLKQSKTLSRHLVNKPSPQPPLTVKAPNLNVATFQVDSRWDHHWPAGEDHAHELLNNFMEERAASYHKARDIPSLDATSSLSPYLATGIVSTSQCLRSALSYNQGEFEGRNEGVNTWINELLWREFYRHLLYAYPRLSMHKPFKKETDQLPWRKDHRLFEQWKAGKTGYPIVDAAMRQLKEKAWMHNRLRMITAMFLTKHLLIDWRLGEAYFMEMLVDGDLASNNGGWQWSASTGVDAVPYFRIFNPTRQSERFDPQGQFIRRYVPELQTFDSKSIHQPTKEQRAACAYPAEIVEHALATSQTKAAFKSLHKQADTEQLPLLDYYS